MGQTHTNTACKKNSEISSISSALSWFTLRLPTRRNENHGVDTKQKTKTNMTDAQSLKQLLSGFVQVFEEHACFLHADRLVCVIWFCQTSRKTDTGNQVTKWLEVPQVLTRLAQHMFHAFCEDFNATSTMLWFPNFHSCFKSGPPLLFSRVDGGAAERIAMHSSGMRHRSVQYQYVICINMY